MKQVLTGDIHNSTRLSKLQREELQEAFRHLENQSEGTYDYFIRGDSFQIYLNNEGLKESQLIKTYLHYKCGIRTRISIGLGEITYFSEEKLSDSDGPVFQYSGRGLDTMKKDKIWNRVTSGDEDFNDEWIVHSAVLDQLENSRTQYQSEVIYWILQRKNQQQIADIIGISQPSVNKRIQGSGWTLLEKILKRYQRFENQNIQTNG